MDSSSSFDGAVFDPSKGSKLSMEQKRELVYQLSKWSHGAPEMLQSWSRQEILQILCAEMGKERKYTGLTKLKIIENLLKVVAEKNSQENETTTNSDLDSSHGFHQRALKRQRKTDQPIRLPVAGNNALDNICDRDLVNVVHCKNSACKAKLSEDYAFCKRCSCCICHQYDDNKDPSLWLACSSDPPYPGVACGLSCHLECAMKHDKSGVGKDGLDGRFICVSCRKVNDLLGCLRKQLMIAKETRRVDILCYRLSLSQKLLPDTTHYSKVYGMVGEAVKLLEAEFGPLTGLPVKKARGIVNRLSSGPEVQRLCASAMESLESTVSREIVHVLSNNVIQESKFIASDVVQFGEISTSSVTVRLGCGDALLGNIEGYTLWHRKAEDVDYPAEPICTLFTPKTTYLLSGLTPATDHIIKVVCFDSTRELGSWELKCRTDSDGDEVTTNATKRSESPQTNSSSLSNPSSVEDETNNVAPNLQLPPAASDAIIDSTAMDQGTDIGDSVILLLDEEGVVRKSTSDPSSSAKASPDSQTLEETSTDNGSNTHAQIATACVPFVGSSEADLPITPFKLESFKDVPGRKSRSKPSKKPPTSQSQREKEPPQDGSSSKKRRAESQDAVEPSGSRDLEYYVKVIRWLECEGHVEATFRQKFLTWYSLRATPQEVRVVKVFVDTLIDDPASLAGQLLDTFSDVISTKHCSGAPSGFCLKLWH